MLQAQTGDADVSAELNMKPPVSTTEHVHSTPQPEKVHVQDRIIDKNYLYWCILSTLPSC